MRVLEEKKKNKNTSVLLKRIKTAERALTTGEIPERSMDKM